MTTTTPDYMTLLAAHISIPERFIADCQPEEINDCKASLEKLGTTLIPFVVARTGNDRVMQKYKLVHQAQTAMMMAYLSQGKLTKCPAIVLKYENSHDYEESALAQLDYCFGTEPEEQFEECPASYNDVQVFEVSDYFLVVVHFNYRHDGPKFSRLLSKMSN